MNHPILGLTQRKIHPTNSSYFLVSSGSTEMIIEWTFQSNSEIEIWWLYIHKEENKRPLPPLWPTVYTIITIPNTRTALSAEQSLGRSVRPNNDDVIWNISCVTKLTLRTKINSLHMYSIWYRPKVNLMTKFCNLTFYHSKVVQIGQFFAHLDRNNTKMTLKVKVNQ